MSDMALKLLSIQSTLSVPKAQFNDFGKYNYRSCEDILSALKPKLLEQGLILTLTDELIAIDGRHYVKATATLTDGTATISTYAYAREALDKKGMDQSQVTGTASSYARKYALNGLLLIDDTKDDDTGQHPDRAPIKQQAARDELIAACETYAAFTGSTAKEVMDAVSQRTDFEKSDECYLRIANELRSEIS